MHVGAHLQGAAGSDWRHDFAEDMSGLVLVCGSRRSVMRVLGWMVVCEPSEQTATEIQEELGLSAGSVSIAMRTLGDMGLLERVARPGQRRVYYRLRARGWDPVLAEHFRPLGEVRNLAEDAIDANDGAADDDDRLEELRTTFALMEDGVADLLRQNRRRGYGEPWAGAASVAADG